MSFNVPGDQGGPPPPSYNDVMRADLSRKTSYGSNSGGGEHQRGKKRQIQSFCKLTAFLLAIFNILVIKSMTEKDFPQRRSNVALSLSSRESV